MGKKEDQKHLTVLVDSNRLSKGAKKIQKKLIKDTNKNNKKLLKLCQEYIDTEDYSLLFDIEYYSDLMIDDIGDLFLLDVCSEDD